MSEASGWRVLSRAMLLKCPECGGGRLFQAPFRLRVACPGCGRPFEPEHGFFLGAMALNIFASELLVTGLFFLLQLVAESPMGVIVPVCIGCAILFPLLFYHHSRSLWVAGAYIASRLDR